MYLDEATCLAMEEGASSPFTCFSCNQPLSHMVEQFLVQSVEGTIVECSCGEELEITDVDVKVIPSSIPLLESSIAKESVWFHSTNVKNWDVEILKAQPTRTGGISDNGMSVPYAHVGTREAALERFSDRKESNGWLYEIRLKESARVSDLVYEDTSDWDFWVRTGYYEDDMLCDAIRYINRWESVGSISMLIDPRVMEIVSVTPLQLPNFVGSRVSGMAA